MDEDESILYSVNEYTADGTKTQYEVSFENGYISRDHIQVRVWEADGETPVLNVTWEWVGDFQISIAPALASGRIVKIYRVTPVEAPLVDFSDGSVINERTLDLNADQAIDLIQELQDAVGSVLGWEDIATATAEAEAAAQAALDAAEAANAAAGDVPAVLAIINTKRALALARGRKPFARSWPEAVAMTDDNADMIGWAAEVGTTGGAGQDIFKVWNASDDIARAGSFRWAVDQAIANGGGRIIFVPVGQFNITLDSIVNITGPNITIDAPGRNVRLQALNNVEMLRVSAHNVIIKRLQFSRLPGLTVIDGDNVYERDFLAIRTPIADQVWIYQCTFTEPSDGAIDCAGSDVVPATPPCRFTIQNCLFRRCDKTLGLGSGATQLTPAPAWSENALDEDAVIIGTLADNVFDCCNERSPRCGTLAEIHSLNNYHNLTEYRRDSGIPGSPYCGVATTGGKLRVTGGYARLAWPTPGAKGWWAFTDPWNDTLNTGPGALLVEDSVVEDGLVNTEANQSYVNALPYTYEADVIPASDEDRETFAMAKYAAAGSQISNLSEKDYTFISEEDNEDADIYPDGYHVVNGEGGYFIKTSDPVAAPNFAKDPTSLALPRGNTLTVASGEITLRAGFSTFAIDTQGAASTDDLDVINWPLDTTDTEIIRDGMILALRASAVGRVTTFKASGQLAGADDIELSPYHYSLFVYEAGSDQWFYIGSTASGSAASGTYTPTGTAVANVSANTPQSSRWVRQGSNVTVTGSVSITPTAATTSTSLGLSLPVASDLTSAIHLNGVAVSADGTNAVMGSVIADITNDRATLLFNSIGTSARTFQYTYSYRVN